MKKTFLERLFKMPYSLLLIPIPILLIHALLSTGTLDIHTHDSYFIIHWKYIDIIIILTLLTLWSLYRSIERILLWQTISWIHIVSIQLFVALLYVNIPTSRVDHPRIYNDVGSPVSGVGLFYAIVAALIFIAQALFLGNVSGGIIKWILSRFRRT
jgi:hypothetical protein